VHVPVAHVFTDFPLCDATVPARAPGWSRSLASWASALQELAAARARQADPDLAADDRAARPKVERKLAHLVRRRHGGRRVRVRGLARVAADFSMLAAAVNLARLGVLGLHWTPSEGWVAA
jgi:signal-transduction protein with cAMP-binding, CBS, and nucleotidyltransferase domain